MFSKFKKLSFKKVVEGLGIFFIFIAVSIIIRDEIIYNFNLDQPNNSEYNYSTAITDNIENEKTDCIVAGIELHGNVVTYISPENIDEDGNLLSDETSSDYVVSRIIEAEANDKIKAIVFEVDSFGGSAVAAEEISNALKKTTKPTVALVRGGATSAAYWAATGADFIIASALSDIGSIGVTMSYVDHSQKNTKDGLTYNQLTTGKFKDYGNPNKPLTIEERNLIIRDLTVMHNNFIKTVAKNRNLNINKVRSLADGSSMPGEMALTNGLIDRIGGFDEVKDYFKDRVSEKIDDCWKWR